MGLPGLQDPDRNGELLRALLPDLSTPLIVDTEDVGCLVSLRGEISWVATPDGELWCDHSDAAGLGVSGPGDVRAGIVAGQVARLPGT